MAIFGICVKFHGGGSGNNLQRTKIFPVKGSLEDDVFLYHRWEMFVVRRVYGYADGHLLHLGCIKL